MALNGDVRMLTGTTTVLETEAPGGAATAASGPDDPDVALPDLGTTGSSLHAAIARGSSSAIATLLGRRE